MTSYDNTIKWLRDNGGFYHPALIRKMDDNGVYGIYTTDDIKRGDLLCQIPKGCAIFYDRYESPNDWSIKLKMTYVLLDEKRKIRNGEESEFKEAFSTITTLDEFKKYHPYFMIDSEKEELKKCSPLFNMIFNNADHLFVSQAQKIKEFNSDFTDDQITEAIVINNTRTWLGMFLPVMDLFNHSAVKGTIINTDDRVSTVHAKVDYQAGDQIYLSYGNKDMLMLTYEYGFWDNEDYHFVFPLVLNFLANTPLSFAVAKKCMDMGMKGLIDDNNQTLLVGINDFGKMEQLGKLVCLSKDGISADFYKFFELFAVSNFQELEDGKGTRLRTLTLLAEHLCQMRGTRLTFDRLEGGSVTYNMMLTCLEERLAVIDACFTWVNDEIVKEGGSVVEAMSETVSENNRAE